jgi:hypothetical protein
VFLARLAGGGNLPSKGAVLGGIKQGLLHPVAIGTVLRQVAAVQARKGLGVDPSGQKLLGGGLNQDLVHGFAEMDGGA